MSRYGLFVGRARIETEESSEALPVSPPAPSASSPPSVPKWLEPALEAVGKSPEEVSEALASAEVESQRMTLGLAILWRDLTRGMPLAAREVLGDGSEPLTASESKRAERVKAEFWPALSFFFIFQATFP